MSLIRKPPTEAMVSANRTNSLKSLGPVTDVGKLNVRLNALKNGITARPGDLCIAELGERPEDLRDIARRLVVSLRPDDRYEDMLVNQMVENRWRRQRVVRAEAGMLTAQRLSFELDYGRKLAGDGRSPASAGEASLAATFGLVALPDSSVKFNFILQCLRVAHEAVGREGFREEGLKRIETVYGQDPGLAGAALLGSYHHGRQNTSPAEAEPGPEDAALRRDFLESLAAEIACFEKLLELHEQGDQKLAGALWEAQNALSEADSNRITKYETFLDRQFERLMKHLNQWRESQREQPDIRSAAGGPPSQPLQASIDNLGDADGSFSGRIDDLLGGAVATAGATGSAKAPRASGRPLRADRASK